MNRAAARQLFDMPRLNCSSLAYPAPYDTFRPIAVIQPNPTGVSRTGVSTNGAIVEEFQS